MPRLNSVMLCPNARASDGNRLEPNNSSTIATIRMIFQVKPTLLFRAMAERITRRLGTDLPSILQDGRWASNAAAQAGCAAELRFQREISVRDASTNRSEDFAAMSGSYR